MATKYNQARDINGFNGFGLPPSDLNYNVTLGAATDTSLTIPSSMGMGANGIASKAVWLAIITYTPNSSVWVALNATAAVPVGGSFAQTNSALNPSSLLLNGGDVVHFFTTPASQSVSVRLYSIS